MVGSLRVNPNDTLIIASLQQFIHFRTIQSQSLQIQVARIAQGSKGTIDIRS